MVAGVLLVIEASVTVLWQEPLTAFITARAQAGLNDDLLALDERAQADLAATEARTKLQIAAQLARRQAARDEEGDAIGRIELPTLGHSYTMVEGTSESSLTKGPGHYSDTELPGQRGTFAVAGHRTTYLAPFRYIDQLDAGDHIIIDMPYGRFVYFVRKTLVVDPSNTWVKKDVRHDRLTLTACHPPYSAAQRIIVFAGLNHFSLPSYRIPTDRKEGQWSHQTNAPAA